MGWALPDRLLRTRETGCPDGYTLSQVFLNSTSVRRSLAWHQNM